MSYFARSTRDVMQTRQAKFQNPGNATILAMFPPSGLQISWEFQNLPDFTILDSLCHISCSSHFQGIMFSRFPLPLYPNSSLDTKGGPSAVFAKVTSMKLFIGGFTTVIKSGYLIHSRSSFFISFILWYAGKTHSCAQLKKVSAFF